MGSTEEKNFNQPDGSPPTTTDEITPHVNFSSGLFVVGEAGEVKVNYLYDGGYYQGEIGFFNMEGMREYDPDSVEFIKEAARRSLTNTELGYVAIQDATEGAKLTEKIGDYHNQDADRYVGIKTFPMSPGMEFGIMLVPNGTVQEVFENPAIDNNRKPLFSMATANPDDEFHMGQIADITGEGSAFVMEDLRVDRSSDRDYNDVIFQLTGALGSAANLDDVIAPDKDWRNSLEGQTVMAKIDELINPSVVEEKSEDLEAAVEETEGSSEEPIAGSKAEEAIAGSEAEEAVAGSEGIKELIEEATTPVEPIADSSIVSNVQEDLEDNLEDSSENPPKTVSIAGTDLWREWFVIEAYSGSDAEFEAGSEAGFDETDSEETFDEPAIDATAESDRESVPGETIDGKESDDAIVGTEGDDYIRGMEGEDDLLGTDGNDEINGNQGNDIVRGGQGDDIVRGGKDNDALYGDLGDDVLYGDLGNDTLTGGAGEDVLIGGEGEDLFVLAIESGTDTIVDFVLGTDKLGLSDGLSFEALTIASGSTPEETIVQLTQTQEILATLTGVEAKDLNEIGADAFAIV